jgi:hypothetical protein
LETPNKFFRNYTGQVYFDCCDSGYDSWRKDFGLFKIFQQRNCVSYKISRNKKPEKLRIEEETANGKAYRNGEYGFELKYPTDWKIREIPSSFLGGGRVSAVYFIPSNYKSPLPIISPWPIWFEIEPFVSKEEYSFQEIQN